MALYESEKLIFLIAGLGNPGREYQHNRHNAGYLFLDRLSERLGLAFNRMESKSLVCKTEFQDRKLILAKPQTYMNLSGQAVGALLRYYKIPLEQFLVAYDEIDLPFGSLRMRPEGGSGGHNGMKSIIEKLGNQEFARLRIGVNRPPGRMEAADYVLQDFNRAEMEELPVVLDTAVDAVLCFLTEGIETAMNQFNAPGFFQERPGDD